jgi:hypothetical protein
MADIKPKYHHISQAFEKGLDYMKLRRSGQSKPLKTPWDSVNNVFTGGLEWGTITTIAGRSGDGKTAIALQMTRSLHKDNPDQKFAILDFQFEMTPEKTALREFSKITKKTLKELVSAEQLIEEKHIRRAERHYMESKNENIYQITDKCSVPEIRAQILHFQQFIGHIPIVVTIDHSYLVAMSGEKNENQMLHNFGSMMTELKKSPHKILFIVLNQMNREIEDQNRKVWGKIGNFPTTSDIYGGDALYNHSDVLFVIDRPFNKGIMEYGPMKYEVKREHLVLHVLKARDGTDSKLLWFEASFKHMVVKETREPVMKNPPPTRSLNTTVEEESCEYDDNGNPLVGYIPPSPGVITLNSIQSDFIEPVSVFSTRGK